jgi:hypothetical protein
MKIVVKLRCKEKDVEKHLIILIHKGLRKIAQISVFEIASNGLMMYWVILPVSLTLDDIKCNIWRISFIVYPYIKRGRGGSHDVKIYRYYPKQNEWEITSEDVNENRVPINRIKSMLCNDLKNMGDKSHFDVTMSVDTFNITDKQKRLINRNEIRNVHLVNSHNERWFTPKWNIEDVSEGRDRRMSFDLRKRYSI